MNTNLNHSIGLVIVLVQRRWRWWTRSVSEVKAGRQVLTVQASRER